MLGQLGVYQELAEPDRQIDRRGCFYASVQGFRNENICCCCMIIASIKKRIIVMKMITLMVVAVVVMTVVEVMHCGGSNM